MLESGPLIRPGGVVQEEEEELEGTGSPPEEDLHALLVKAWEAKVFPVIQKRFRNDHERKSGLEQIKGALQLGECWVWSCDCLGCCVTLSEVKKFGV